MLDGGGMEMKLTNVKETQVEKAHRSAVVKFAFNSSREWIRRLLAEETAAEKARLAKKAS